MREEIVRQIQEFTETNRLRVFPGEAGRQSGSDGTDITGSPLRLLSPVFPPVEDLPEERIPDPTIVAPSMEVSGKELVKILQEEIKTWPSAEREIFELHYLVGFDQTEIAAIRPQPPQEVDVLLGKIQLRLRDFFRGLSATPNV